MFKPADLFDLAQTEHAALFDRLQRIRGESRRRGENEREREGENSETRVRRKFGVR